MMRPFLPREMVMTGSIADGRRRRECIEVLNGGIGDLFMFA